MNGSHSTPHHQYPHSSGTYSGNHSGGRFSHDMDMDLGLYGNEGLFDELEGLDGPQRYDIFANICVFVYMFICILTSCVVFML